MKKQDRTAAIILSAGFGKRMQSDIPKQYMLLKGKPVIYYTIRAFEESQIDDIILVTGAGDENYCRTEIIEKYNFQKIRAITAGGAERYHSVYNGLKTLQNLACGYVFIHDGARPFISQNIIDNAKDEVKKSGACITGVPVKDTIKIVDENGYVETTPRRDYVYQIQTPQVFAYDLIWNAYSVLMQKEQQLLSQGIKITDDAMVVETLMNYNVKVIPGSYDNIKITTPEDLLIAKNLVN